MGNFYFFKTVNYMALKAFPIKWWKMCIYEKNIRKNESDLKSNHLQQQQFQLLLIRLIGLAQIFQVVVALFLLLLLLLLCVVGRTVTFRSCRGRTSSRPRWCPPCAAWGVRHHGSHPTHPASTSWRCTDDQCMGTNCPSSLCGPCKWFR